MNIFEVILVQLAAVFSIGAALINPYPRSHHPQKAAYRPHGSYQYEAEEPSTTEASNTFKVEVDVAQLVRNFLGLPETQARSGGEPEDSQKFLLELKTPDFSQMWESFKNMLRESTDRRHEGAYVEEGPGTFKSESVVYPKNFHQGNLLKLLELKEKMQKEKKAKSRRGWDEEDDELEFL